jgi:hypothetical protein
MNKNRYNDALKAVAEIHRLAQGTAILRMFEEENDRKAVDVKEIEIWAKKNLKEGKIEPSEEDYEQVKSKYPELVNSAKILVELN